MDRNIIIWKLLQNGVEWFMEWLNFFIHYRTLASAAYLLPFAQI